LLLLRALYRLDANVRLARLRLIQQRLCSEPVALDSQSGDDALGNGRGVRVMPEAFASVDVADVDFDGGYIRTADSISQSDTGMGIGPRIEHDSLAVAFGQLGDFVNERSFVIRLKEIEFHLWKLRFQSVRDIIQGIGSVDFRIALAKAVEIGSILDGDSFHDWRIYWLLEPIARIFGAFAIMGNRLK